MNEQEIKRIYNMIFDTANWIESGMALDKNDTLKVYKAGIVLGMKLADQIMDAYFGCNNNYPTEDQNNGRC